MLFLMVFKVSISYLTLLSIWARCFCFLLSVLFFFFSNSKEGEGVVKKKETWD